MAPDPPPIDSAEIHRRHERQALENVGIFKRAERSRATSEANAAAESEIAAQKAADQAERERMQAELNSHWEALLPADGEWAPTGHTERNVRGRSRDKVSAGGRHSVICR
jgi:hypothetical protein